jgi:glutamate N-acetyltransferase/amino-acid N-acetyltransferase
MKFHTRPIFPRGFQCASRNCGLKPEAKDLSVFYSSVPAAAAAVFTRNRFPGAPIILGRETIQRGRLQAIVVNSKVSNVGTGEEGLLNARRMAIATGTELRVRADEVLVSSTGVIGRPLPIDLIERGLGGIGSELVNDPMVGAEGIMTTDTHPKALSVDVGGAVITWVAKGAGMIEPNMATMLVYIFTDAKFEIGSSGPRSTRRSTCFRSIRTRARPTPARSSRTVWQVSCPRPSSRRRCARAASV